MDRYTEFKFFMVDVIDEADKKCQSRYFKSLDNLYEVSEAISSGLQKILEFAGWPGFVAVVSLLTLGPFVFGGALASFAITPMGWVVIAALSTFGGVIFIRMLYKNRQLPIAIKATGSAFKEDYEKILSSGDHKKDEVDALLDKASDHLIKQALKSLGIGY